MRALSLILILSWSLPALALPAAGHRGMVATAHPAATQAGMAMLRQGGNAFDAATAAAFALAVAEPYSSGIGGGGFAMVRHGKELKFLDFREVAPRKATPDMYLVDGEPRPDLSRDGALAAAVPGAVAGYLQLHERWGKLPRAQVLAPAIRMARDGIVVSPRYRQATGYRLEVLRRDPEAARIFLYAGEDGYEIPPIGHRIVQPDLARTLEILAQEGASAFYEGSIAKQLAADMKERGGLIDEVDLAAFEVKERAPLIGSYRGHAIATAPPPSAGGHVILTLLNALEKMPEAGTYHDPKGLHLYLEVLKRAYADRSLFGDPAFVDVPVKALIAKERTEKMLKALGEKTTPSGQVPPGQYTAVEGRLPAPQTDDGTDTTHLDVIDGEGNAVSITTTVNYAFGAAIVAKGTGILWNDEMDDFTVAPGVPNAFGVYGAASNSVAPGKIPLSSMAPTFVFAGETVDSPLRLLVGSPGGPRIPTTIVQVIHNHLALGADVEKALTLGRIHHQHVPDMTLIEPFTLDPLTIESLRKRGHTVEERQPWSNATAISIDPETGLRTGSADPRGLGSAMAQ